MEREEGEGERGREGGKMERRGEERGEVGIGEREAWDAGEPFLVQSSHLFFFPRGRQEMHREGVYLACSLSLSLNCCPLIAFGIQFYSYFLLNRMKVIHSAVV